IAASLAALALMRGGRRAPAGGVVSLAAIREGLRFVRQNPVVLGWMTLDMFAVIFGGAAALLPIYATEILRVGPRGYGLLTSSLELGALVMSLALTILPPIRRAGVALLAAVSVYGLATIVFGLSRWFPLSVLAYMTVGMADQVSVVMRGTAIQLSTPDALRGRVSSVSMIFILLMGMIRGGSSESTVVIADREILTPPIVPSAWALLAMHPEGLPALGSKAEPGGVLVFNSSLVTAPVWDGISRVPAPATEMAKAMGQPMGASMIALGALAATTGVVAVASLHAALGEVLPPHRRKLIDTNTLCITRGAEHVAAAQRVAAWR